MCTFIKGPFVMSRKRSYENYMDEYVKNRFGNYEGVKFYRKDDDFWDFFALCGKCSRCCS